MFGLVGPGLAEIVLVFVALAAWYRSFQPRRFFTAWGVFYFLMWLLFACLMLSSCPNF